MKHVLNYPRALFIIKLCLTPAIFLMIALVACKDQQNDEQSDKLSIGASSTDSIPGFPNTAQGQQLKRHILQMYAVGVDAEKNYQASLSELRKDTTMNTVVYEVYKNTNEEQYELRSLLVETLKELRSPASLGILSEIASSKIPPELSKNPEYSTRVEEVIIRTTSIEGISYLAQNQNLEARRVLLGLIDNEDLTIRQMSIRGYLSSFTSDKQMQDEINSLKNRLPKEQHWMITNKATDIKTVPHPAMPDTFNLKTRSNKNSPKLKN